MVATVASNPMLQTNSAGTFVITSDGGVQGTFLDDPAVRFQLRGGILATAETIPMWGGVGIYEGIPSPLANTNPLGTVGTGTPDPSLGPIVGRATILAPALGSATAPGTFPLTGFSVFNQAVNMVTSTGSPVPLAGSGMGVHYFRLGTNASLWVGCDAILASLETGNVQQQVSWDFTQQMLIPYYAAINNNVLTGLTWGGASGANGSAIGTTTSAHGLVVGDQFTLTGFTPAGWNGTYTAAAGTTASQLNFLVTPNPGTVTVEGLIVGGGGALPCRINRIITTNGMAVNYSAVTNTAQWNYNAALALITI